MEEFRVTFYDNRKERSTSVVTFSYNLKDPLRRVASRRVKIMILPLSNVSWISREDSSYRRRSTSLEKYLIFINFIK
jgi:hypothetical protein